MSTPQGTFTRIPWYHLREKFYTLLVTKGPLIAAVLFVVLVPVVSGAQEDLNKPFGDITSLTELANAIFKLGVILCVLAAAIYIALGAFAYFAAAGNAAMAQKGKELIQRSIIGLILALIAWIILNTIHPQFASELTEPSLGN